jgi:hypothetical protein
MSEQRIDIDTVFHMAACAECGPPALPFYDADERDQWMAAHSEATGHHVSTHTEMRGQNADGGTTTVHLFPPLGG